MSAPAPVKRPRRARLPLAERRALRPREIEAAYGIPESSLHVYFNHSDPAKRLPSVKLPGRPGRKTAAGARVVLVADLDAWLERWKETGAEKSQNGKLKTKKEERSL